MSLKSKLSKAAHVSRAAKAPAKKAAATPSTPAPKPTAKQTAVRKDILTGDGTSKLTPSVPAQTATPITMGPTTQAYLAGPFLEVAQLILERLALLQTRTAANPNAAADKAPVWETLDSLVELGADFDALTIKGRIFASIEALSKESAKSIGEELTQRFELAGVEECAVANYRGTHATGVSERVDPVKLVENGVSADVVEACTDRTPYAFIRWHDCAPKPPKATE